MKKSTIVSKMVCLITVICLVMTNTVLYQTAAAQTDVVRIIACSDFQHPQGNDAGKTLVQGILNKMSASSAAFADGFLCCGDYDYEYTETAAGVNALKEAVSGSMNNEDNMVFAQGNHDQVPSGTAGMSNSGKNDPASGAYGVFVINEDDYMWGNTDENTVKRTAQSLIEYMNEKLSARYEKPIFVISHLPLHYSMRTKNDGDGQYAKYIFDVLNEAGEKGLNIFFLFGHDHSNGWDDYLGGARVYLKKGDTIQIAQNSRDNYKTENLQFTYMNAGYVGYYENKNAGADDTLTMTSFDIAANEVTVNRYSQSGICDLKAYGVINSYKNEAGYAPDTAVYPSPQTVSLTAVSNITPINDLISDFDITDGERYVKINSLDELEDGGRYLLIANRPGVTGEPAIMLPKSVEINNRIGFEAEPNFAFNGGVTEGDYSVKEWTFTKSGDGWRIGNGEKFAKLNNTSDKAITATLEEKGDVFTISEASGYYNFSNGTYYLNYNGTRALVNGYANSPAEFYIYRLAPSILSVDHYESVQSLNELKDGEKYLLIVKNFWNDNDRYIMIPQSAVKQGREGFDMESTDLFGDNKVAGNYRDKEWIFTKSDDGWKIGNGTQFAKNIGASSEDDGDDNDTVFTLANDGDAFTISGTQGSYIFSSGDYVLNWDWRYVVSGYKTNPAKFYIYRFVPAQPCRIMSLQESENGTVTAGCIADQEVQVFIAAYDIDGGLLDVICERISQDADVTLTQQSGAAFYKAFMWNDDYQPLCRLKHYSVTK